MNSGKLCRIKTFKGLKDEIKETMDLKEYKKWIFQSHVKSKFSKTERAGIKKAFLRIIKKENEKNETMFFRIYAWSFVEKPYIGIWFVPDGTDHGIVSDSEADDPVLSGICTCNYILFYSCRIL